MIIIFKIINIYDPSFNKLLIILKCVLINKIIVHIPQLRLINQDIINN